MAKRITIKDIAKELNIHHSTVSRALRDDPRVHAETKELVLNYAREHEYQTNMNALHLRGGQNNVIALIVPNINHSFFADIISELTDIASHKGFVISIFQSNESVRQEREIINTIIKHNFAGVIISVSKTTTDSEHFQKLRKFGIPFVFFDRVREDIPAPKVLVNNYEITYQATEYLLSRGYGKIAHLTGTTDINVFRDRQNGYLDALKKNNIEYKQPVIILDDFTVENGKKALTQLWSSEERPDAIITSSVYLTMGIILQARFLGINISKNLGLIAFGSQLNSEIIQLKITSIEQPEKEIASLSFSLLEKIMNGELEKDEPVIEKVKAVINFKESC